MRSGLRWSRTVALLAAFALFVAACGSDSTDGETTTTAAGGETTTTAEGGETTTTAAGSGDKPEIVFAGSDTVNLIELHTFRSTTAYSATAALYDPLIRQVLVENADGLLVGSRTEHEGAGAESYEIELTSDGKTVATFQINQNARFPDGSPVTAEDYKYTFDRTIEGPGYIGLLLPFIGISSTDQIQVLDEYTLQITADVQSPLFERFMTFQVFGAINKDLAEANATADDAWAFAYFNDHNGGGGPYDLESFNPDTAVVLRPNPDYWEAAAVANSGVIMRTIPDANQRALLVQSGEIDMASGIPPKLLAELANNPDVKIYQAPTTGVAYMGMNQTITPLDNVDLRRAIVAAVPYQALLDQVMFGYATPANGVVTSTMETHDAAIGGLFVTDLEAAAQHLADSGVGTVNLQLGVRESRSTDQEAAVLIQDSLRQVGINVEVVVLPDADFATRINENQLPLFIHDWFSWGEDPFYQMQFLTVCDQFTNYARFCSEEYDALVQEGVFSVDADQRQQVSSAAQQIFYDEAVWAPLWAADRTVVTGKCVTGVDQDYTLVPRFLYTTKTDSC
jgi:peptide/nickel transport system substrate-binding protein